MLNQLKDTYMLRRDPVLLFYMGRTYEKIGKKREALDAYRRYAASEYAEPERRTHMTMVRARLPQTAQTRCPQPLVPFRVL